MIVPVLLEKIKNMWILFPGNRSALDAVPSKGFQFQLRGIIRRIIDAAILFAIPGDKGWQRKPDFYLKLSAFYTLFLKMGLSENSQTLLGDFKLFAFLRMEILTQGGIINLN